VSYGYLEALSYHASLKLAVLIDFGSFEGVAAIHHHLFSFLLYARLATLLLEMISRRR
jgi:hypothetical protein